MHYTKSLSLHVFVLLLSFFFAGCYQKFQPLPEGLDVATPERPVPEAELLVDLAWVDDDGERHTEQEIFRRVYKMIHRAEKFIVIDMFLFNNFGFVDDDDLKPVTDKLTSHLVKRKKERPELSVIFISDPINTVYGGAEAQLFEDMRSYLNLLWYNTSERHFTVDYGKYKDHNPLRILQYRFQEWSGVSTF